MGVPEVVTPWLGLLTTSIAALAAIGGAYIWLRRKAEHAFVAAVREVVHPLAELVERELQADHGLSMKDRVLETLALAQRTATDLPIQSKLIEEQLRVRSTIIDDRFAGLERRMASLEVRQSRDTQKVVDAVQGVQDSVSPPSAP
jgi:hypothetical protein